MKIPLARSKINEEEAAAIARVIDRGRLALGPEVNAFEEEFASWLAVDAAVATNSGTSALIAALRAVGVRPGDEVIVPALTFVATANAVLNCGARPVLVDVLPDSWNLDPLAAAEAIGKNTRAIIAVHLFGLSGSDERVNRVGSTSQCGAGRRRLRSGWFDVRLPSPGWIVGRRCFWVLSQQVADDGRRWNGGFEGHECRRDSPRDL